MNSIISSTIFPICQFLPLAGPRPSRNRLAQRASGRMWDVTAKHDVVENAHFPRKQGQVSENVRATAATCDSVRAPDRVMSLAEQGYAPQRSVDRKPVTGPLDHGGFFAASIRTDEAEDFTPDERRGSRL